MKHIDVDSELKNLQYKDTLCPNKKYKPNNICHNTITNSDLLSNPYCQNYKKYNFNDKTKKYKTKCQQSPQIINKNDDYSPYSKNNYNCSLPVKLNYTNCHYKTNKNYENCSSIDFLEQCSKVTDWKSQPLLYSNNRDMSNKILSVGPNRTNHECENLWNNVSRRKYINNNKI